jgi:AAA15 family ATPase/GTPase
MIKQISVKNLYNFKDEICFDFTLSKTNDDITYFNYGKNNVGAFSLIYGKNNVGKSNFFKIVEESIDFILNNTFNLKVNKSNKEDTSAFEIIIVNDNYETKYGFEFTIDKDEVNIIDEWLFSKINNSTRESVIFDRKEKKFNKKIKHSDKAFMANVESNELYLFYLKKIKYEVINDFVKSIDNDFIFLSCIEKEDIKLENYLDIIMDNENFRDMISDFINSMDTNMQIVYIKKVDKEFKDNVKKMNKMLLEEFYSESDEIRVEASNKLAAILKENANQLMPLNHQGSIFKKYDENGDEIIYTVSLVDKDGNIFDYSEISTGTKQMFNLLLVTMAALNENNSVLLFDEIEAGLHYDVISSYLDYLNDFIKQEGYKMQIIASTHQEKLLDFKYISRETEILLKEDNGILSVDYISNYNIRKDQVVSKRYLLDAFEANPNIIEPLK